MSFVPEGLSPIVNIDGVDRYRPPMEEVRGLAWNLGSMVTRSSFNPKYLVGVTRGGLTVADCVSRSLNIKDIQTLAIEVYKENGIEGEDPEVLGDQIKVYRRPELPKDGEDAFFVDDVLHTGTTVNYIRQNWPAAAIGVVYVKKLHRATLKEVDFYGKYTGDVWIDFPWEREAQLRADLRNNDGSIVV